MSPTDPVQSPQLQVPPAQPPTPPAVPPMGQPPVGPPGGYPQPPGPAQFQPAPAYAAPVQESSSSKSTVALVLGIGGFFLGLFTGIPAIIVGMMARKQAKRLGEPTGMATAGIVLGWIFTILSIVSLILFLMLSVFVSKNAPAIVDNAQSAAIKVEAARFVREYTADVAFFTYPQDAAQRNDAANQAAQSLVSGSPALMITVKTVTGDEPLEVALSNSNYNKCVTFTVPTSITAENFPPVETVEGPAGSVASGGGDATPTCS